MDIDSSCTIYISFVFTCTSQKTFSYTIVFVVFVLCPIYIHVALLEEPVT